MEKINHRSFKSHKPAFTFLAFLGVSLVIGSASGLAMNTFFKTDVNKGNEAYEAYMSQEVDINDFSSSLKIDYPWIKKGLFTLKTSVLQQSTSKYHEIDGLVEYDYSKNKLKFNSISIGEMTFISTFDSSIFYKTDFSIKLHSNDVQRLLTNQYPEFFEDGYVSNVEIQSVKKITINDTSRFDASDLSIFTSLESIFIENENEVTRFINNTARSNVKYYVPESQYGDYASTDAWNLYMDNLFTKTTSNEYASVMLFKNKGQIIGTSDKEYECYQIKKGEYFVDLPKAEQMEYPGNNFLGWKTKSGSAFDDLIIVNEDIKLYAEWQNKVYTVTYHINDDHSENIVKEFKYNDALRIINDSEVPKGYSNEYQFIGWSTDPNSKKVEYKGNDKTEDNFFDDSFLNIDLYAVWVYKNFTINIYEGDTFINSIACTYNNSIKVPSSITGPGTYLGVTSKKDSQVLEYEKGATINLKYNEEGKVEDEYYLYLLRGEDNFINFYAVFKQEHYSITYRLNNDEVYVQDYTEDGHPETNLLTGDTNCSILDEMDFTASKIDKVGHYFIGWYRTYLEESYLYTRLDNSPLFKDFDHVVKVGEDGYLLNDSDYFNGESDVELTPKYAPNIIGISFDKGSSDYMYSAFSTDYTYSTILYFTGSIGRTGYRLGTIGYYSTNGNIILKQNDRITGDELRSIYLKEFEKLGIDRHSKVPNHHLNGTLTATWNFITDLTVTFINNGKQHSKLTGISYGDKVNQPSNPTDAPSGKNTFKGWSLSDGGSLVSFPISVTSNLTIYAVWTYVAPPAPEPEEPSCFAKGTLVSMADGSKKKIEDVQMGEMIITVDLYSGNMAIAPVILIHHETDVKAYSVTLTFENGRSTTIIGNHTLLDFSKEGFVTIDKDASQYIGDKFYFEDGGSILVDVEVTLGTYEFYGLASAIYFTVICDGLLTLGDPGQIYTNIAPIGENCCYDQADLDALVEQYGLLDYADVADVIEEDLFNEGNVKYMGITIGRGFVTLEELRQLLAYLQYLRSIS